MRSLAEVLRDTGESFSSAADLEALLRALRQGLDALLPSGAIRVHLLDGGAAPDVPLELVRDALAARRSVLADDASRGVSVLAAPLVGRSAVHGVVVLERPGANAFAEADRPWAEALLALAGLALENLGLASREHAAREEAERLGAAARALSSTLDLTQVFEVILRELRALIPYDSAAVMELTGSKLEIIGGHGFANLPDLLGVSFELSEDNPNREVAHTLAPVVVDDAPARYPAFRKGPHAATPIRSWLGVPLLFRGRLTGMVTVDKQQAGFFGAEHARLAALFASHAAIALENARLFASVERELAERAKAEDRSRAFVEQAP